MLSFYYGIFFVNTSHFPSNRKVRGLFFALPLPKKRPPVPSA